VRYWDTSALVPLVIEESSSQACRDLLREDRSIAVWALTRTEMVSADRLLGVHGLRAADALQLAAALALCLERPAGWGFVTLDDRLATAAAAEGFEVHSPRPE